MCPFYSLFIAFSGEEEVWSGAWHIGQRGTTSPTHSSTELLSVLDGPSTVLGSLDTTGNKAVPYLCKIYILVEERKYKE